MQWAPNSHIKESQPFGGNVIGFYTMLVNVKQQNFLFSCIDESEDGVNATGKVERLFVEDVKGSSSLSFHVRVTKDVNALSRRRSNPSLDRTCLPWQSSQTVPVIYGVLTSPPRRRLARKILRVDRSAITPASIYGEMQANIGALLSRAQPSVEFVIHRSIDRSSPEDSSVFDLDIFLLCKVNENVG